MAPGFMPLPLLNTSNLCYRNSVLNSLFSIDYFLNLLDLGQKLAPKPIYRVLGDAAQRFRENNRQGENAENDVREFMRIIGTGSEGNKDWGPQEGFRHTGRQQAAEEFLVYLMGRLCDSELTDDLLP